MTIYLYKKTHSKTGLQYLGKTIQDPFKYKGSGTYWLRHLQIHGNEVKTEILKECQTNQDIQFWGKYYSELFNIVLDKNWANIKQETGEGGSAPGSRPKTSLTMKGRPAHNKGKKQIHKKHKSKSIPNSTKGKSRPKICCCTCRKIVDIGNLSRYHNH
jgi:hypothetical protein